MLALTLLLACSGSSSTSSPTDVAAKRDVTPPLPAVAPVIAQDPNGVVASWEGGQITYKELHQDIGTQLAKLEVEYLQNRYNLERQALDEAAYTKLIETEAAKRGVSPEDVIKAEVEDKVTPPTAAEVEEFYPVIKRQLRNQPLDQVRPQVEQVLLNRKQSERMQEWLTELESSYKLQTHLPYPNLPRIEVSTDDDPALGSAEAPVTIVEFADYQCGYCRKIYPTLRELLTEYDGKVRLVYRDYPLGGPNPAGMTPAIAANCAGQQGKYWEMHDTLMKASSYSGPELEAHAQSSGLDVAKWKDCMNDNVAQVQEITADFEAGREVGVSGTPAFFINGIFLNGAVPKEQFVSVIERELGEG
ncbi:MAG: thioredoxin domain-containing protein [Alphaproteobacteria bacterium]|nr:thioredoxin domain-containing protein [Alphaproteobacteria bacterium]